MLLVGATDAEHAFYSPDSGIDWNVIVLLLGMMIIVAVLKRTGSSSTWRSGGQTRPRSAVSGHGDLVLVTGERQRSLDNVTTVLLVAPVTFLVCDRLGVPVVPFLIAEAMPATSAAPRPGRRPTQHHHRQPRQLSYNDFLVHLTRSS